MHGSNPVRVCIGIPSYKGPHLETFDEYQAFYHYLGRLQERSQVARAHPDLDLSQLPPLDPTGLDPEAELLPSDPAFHFFQSVMKKNSLIGQARDEVIKQAKAGGADRLMFFDDDMLFLHSAFLKLWRAQKPIIGALAFTAREPIAPVLYRFKRMWDFKRMREDIDIEPVWDYPVNEVFRLDGFGTGVCLIDMKVFDQLQPPWFYGSMGSGEDVHFCWKAGNAGIPVYCDTSVKTRHVPNEHWRWMDEPYYLAHRERNKEIYAQIHAHHRNPDLA